MSISIVGHEGPMIEGKQYELQCDVYNFAPVHLLTVNWYKGQHLVAKTSFSDSTKTPVNQSTRFHMSLNRDDDGVRYRCEAELKLSRTRAGAQTPFEVASQVLGLTVHCTSLLKLLTTLQPPHNHLKQFQKRNNNNNYNSNSSGIVKYISAIFRQPTGQQWSRDLQRDN